MMFSLSNKAVAQKTLAEWKEKQADLKTIERSVADLHSLFLQVQMTVEEQGDKLDRIEAQVQDTEVVTNAAAGEMISAVKKKKSAQRTRWIICLLIIVVLGILGTVLGVTLTNK